MYSDLLFFMMKYLNFSKNSIIIILKWKIFNTILFVHYVSNNERLAKCYNSLFNS